MKVPLMMKSTRTGLRIYHNGNFEFVPFPFKPFNLLERETFPDFFNEKVEKWTNIPKDVQTDYVRVEFDSTQDQKEFLDRHSEKSQHIYNNNYLEQLYITEPNFILNYPHNSKIRIMFWDIEVRTLGDDVFPKPENQPIICIGFSIWDYMPDGSKQKIGYHLINDYDENKTDLYILRAFIEFIKEYDPDILAGYNSQSFDFPYLHTRCKIRNVDMSPIGREGKEPFISNQGDIYLDGRIHYDMYLKVQKDQSLFGLKNKSLKTLARHFNVPLDKEQDVELKEAIEHTEKVRKENPDLLWAYQEADVIRTEHVGAVYIRNDIVLAETVQVPLNDTMTMYASFIPKIFLARNFYVNNLISTETNFSKYNSTTGTYNRFRRYDNKELKFQGALVGLYKHGKFNTTKKLDFTSMYPSAICTFNLGPDTTKLIDVKPYSGTYGFHKDDKYNWYRVPDENFGVDLIVRVRNDKEGLLKKEIKRLWAERKVVKKLMKEYAGTDLEATYDSQQLAIKVILNSIFGIQGLRSSTYGDMITGVMITAMCRWTTTKTIQKYEDCLIELDSVTGDTPIWVKNTDTDMIDIIPIEDLHDCNSKYKEISNMETMTRNGWATILKTKRHEVTKDIYRTRTQNGFVDITEDHSLFNINEKELTPKDIIINKTKLEVTGIVPNSSYTSVDDTREYAWLLGFLLSRCKINTYKTKFGTLKTKIIFKTRYKHLKSYVVYLLNAELGKIFHCRFKSEIIDSNIEIVPWGRESIKVYTFLTSILYTKNGYAKVPPMVMQFGKQIGEAFVGGVLANKDYHTLTLSRRKNFYIETYSKTLAAGINYIWSLHNSNTAINIDKDNKIRCIRRDEPLFNSNQIVIENNIINKDTEVVYDISTEDHTFVNALGNFVLHNTDGLAIDKHVSEKDTNDWLNELMDNTYKITENYMQMELDEVGPAYFCAMKNYVTEIDGTPYIHGSSLKSSRNCNVQDRARDLAIDHWFNSKPVEEVIREAYDFSNCKVEDFEYRVKLSKELDDYDDKTGQIAFLSEQYNYLTESIPVEDTTLHYVISTKTLSDPRFKKFYQKKTGHNYKLVKLVESVSEIDTSYYNEQIDKMLKKFQIQRDKQLDMFSLLGVDDTPKDVDLDKVPHNF